MTISGDWQLQDVAKVPQAGAEVSTAGFKPTGWYAATVPGTVLTTLVNNHVYPEPLYGENNRPENIPESLARTSYWYRTEIDVPKSYKGQPRLAQLRRHQLLRNGVGQRRAGGHDARRLHPRHLRHHVQREAGQTSRAGRAGGAAAAPRRSRTSTPCATAWARTAANRAIDGPTFLCTIGWDWIPAIRDRDTGIWQKVFLSATGPVLVKDPLVTTDLPLPRTDSTDVAVQATVENVGDKPLKGVLKGSIENIAFEQPVELAPHSKQLVSFDSKNTPALHIDHPRLWWPNGYGAAESLQSASQVQGWQARFPTSRM